MTLKEIYEALEKIDNGAELITGIKTEVNKLNNEAKKHHEAGAVSYTHLTLPTTSRV